MNLTIYELIILMGIPSAITGIAVWALKRWLEKRESDAEKRNAALTDILIATIMQNDATLTLAKTTAEAIARIPDAHCNGDMHEALEYAKAMKHEQRELLTKLGVTFTVKK